MLKVLSLFSGIGAFEKALERQGIEYQLVNYCEIDKYASKSYSLIHNVSEQMNLGDITKINIESLNDNIDFLTHGSPCQDFSLAGKQAGGDEGSNTRSSLMWNTVDIVKYVKPKVVLWENVKNLLSKKHRHNFDAYIQVMGDLGYNSYYQVLNAKDYGIPQNRERVFTVSIRKDIDTGSFEFPEPMELKLRLKDMLEDEVDEKYYLSEEIQKRFEFTDDTFTKSIVGTTKAGARMDDNFILDNIDTDKEKFKFDSTNDDLKNIYSGGFIAVKENTKAGYKVAHEGDGVNISSRMKWQRGNVQKQSCQTITTSGGNDRGVVTSDYRIRKLTPRECFRLMGFDDSDFDKVMYAKDIKFLEGGLKCSAKLKVVNEKQRHINMDTYVSCTINDILGMEMLTMMEKEKEINKKLQENMKSVNIVIDLLEEKEHLECATNIIKCSDFMETPCILIKELDQHHMAIIELEQTDNTNTEKYMKITLEENYCQQKLFIISILIKLIIESKIYTYIHQEANISGFIDIITNSKNNSKMVKLSNLKMETTTQQISNSSLYKQAGNSIVVNVLEEIYKQLFKSIKL